MDRLANQVVRRFLAFKYQPKESKQSKIDRLSKLIRDESGVGIGTARDIADAVIRKRNIERLSLQKKWPISEGQIEGPKGRISLKKVKEALNK